MLVRILKILKRKALLVKNACEREGIWCAVRQGIQYMVREGFVYPLVHALAAYYHGCLRGRATFTFQGETYNYFCQRYHWTWKNGRAVEVRVSRAIVEKHRGKRVLEVGNVLSHYFPIEHDVLDKYEKAPGVIREDIVDFQPAEKYDLVVSISTLEHVGWDEKSREPEKILTALENLSRNVIAPGGKIVITLPLGYNPDMDTLLLKNKIRFKNIGCLKRISLRNNEWREAQWDELWEEGSRYQGGGYGANAIVIVYGEY